VTGMTDGMTAVIFDFYGTLTPVNPSGIWSGHVARLAAVLGVEPKALARALDESYAERFTGALGDTRQTFATIAARLGITPDEGRLDEVVRLRLAMQDSLFRLRPEVLEVAGCGHRRGHLLLPAPTWAVFSRGWSVTGMAVGRADCRLLASDWRRTRRSASVYPPHTPESTP